MGFVDFQHTIQKHAILGYLAMRGYKDQDLLFKLILAAIVWFVEGFKEGAKMRTSDIYKVALFIQEYKMDSFEDVVLCFRMAEDSELIDKETGKPIQRYSAMSVEILKKYWIAYLDFKAEIREAKKLEDKAREGDYRTETDTRLIAAQKKQDFISDINAANNQLNRWEKQENTTSVQNYITSKYKDK